MARGHVQIIQDEKKIYAWIFRHHLTANGARFLTPAHSTLQVGLLEHPQGTSIRAHRHPDLKYKVNITQEFLYIERGIVEATIYQTNWSVVKRVKLYPGDALLSIAGGHSFRILKKCRIIEIKQGPYPGDVKAKIFMPER